jgi:hypothetical protein
MKDCMMTPKEVAYTIRVMTRKINNAKFHKVKNKKNKKIRDNPSYF